MLFGRKKEVSTEVSRYQPLLILLGKLGRFTPLILLFGAVFVVRRLLNEYTYDEVVTDISRIPRAHLAIALVLSVANYMVLTMYDFLGSRYVRARIPLRKVALASFVAYAFSQNLGASLLSGGAVRYRFYQKEGLSGVAIAKIIGFTFFHFWLGLFLLAGALALFVPGTFAEVFHLSELSCQLVGAAVAFPSAVYLLFAFFPRLLARRYRRLMPRTDLACAGLLVCVVDWLLAASVFYMTLSGDHEITLLLTIAAFIGAQVVGVVSHVPGGLGVFEATVAYLLSPHHDNSELISSLILFRLIYYFIPFLIAVGILTVSEVATQAKKLSVMPGVVAGFESLEMLFVASAPLINSIFCICTGLTLLFGSTARAVMMTPMVLGFSVPLPVFETAHFVASVLGVVLIYLGVGLRRRLKGAWRMCLVLLYVAIPLSIGRAGRSEPLFLCANIAFLYFTRGAFYRVSALGSSVDRSPWIWAGGVVAIAITFGLFTFQDFEYSHLLWWQFSYDGEYPRFLRGIAGMCLGYFVGGAFFALAKPKIHEPMFPTESDLSDVSSVMNKSKSTMGLLALMADKEIIFAEKRDAFLMWRESGSCVVALGDPEGSAESIPELCWKLSEVAEETAKLCVFYGITAGTIPFMMDLGLRCFKVGEEGIVDLSSFSISGTKARGLRGGMNRVRRGGVTFRIMERVEVSQRISELRAVSDEWLAQKNTSEKCFSIGFFDGGYLSRFRCAVAELDGQIIGFANLFESSAREELSIDLMRYKKDAPNGLMDFLFVSLFEWGRDNGYKTFSLGMTPLAGLESDPLSSSYARLANVIYRYGERFYNFDGLRKYKEKFHPEWQPRYVACPSGLYLPIVLSNVSTLISGGLKGMVRK